MPHKLKEVTETETVAAPRNRSSRSFSPESLDRRRFLALSACAAAGLGLYSSEIARHEIQVVERRIHLSALPPSFAGFRLLQLSDIHLAEFTESYFLERVIRRINELRPDLVAFTGDFVSDEPLPRRFGKKMGYVCAELLSRVTCPLRYAVLGNHDLLVDSWAVTDALQTHGIEVLRNRAIPIERGGERIWLAGLAEVEYQHPDIDATLADPSRARGEPVILMVHEPDYADNLVGRKISLILSGHSHGGQVRLPFLGPIILPYLGRKYVEGHFSLPGDLQLYVNRGIGTCGLPLRLFCPPEITVLTLQPRPASL